MIFLAELEGGWNDLEVRTKTGNKIGGISFNPGVPNSLYKLVTSEYETELLDRVNQEDNTLWVMNFNLDLAYSSLKLVKEIIGHLESHAKPKGYDSISLLVRQEAYISTYQVFGFTLEGRVPTLDMYIIKKEIDIPSRFK